MLGPGTMDFPFLFRFLTKAHFEISLVPVFLLIQFGLASASVEYRLQHVAEALFGRNQGVFVRAEDGAVLASLNADRAYHPASVTKVATTLALLRHLGPAYRFKTGLQAEGRISQGTLTGTLIIKSEGDPYLVSENAFLILLALRAAGLDTVAGAVRPRGSFIFNWRPDPRAHRFQQALSGRLGADRWKAVQSVRAEAAGVELSEVALSFRPVHNGKRRLAPQPLLVHYSPPLIRHLKDFNGFSNNVFHLFSQRIGGPRAVERSSRSSIPPELARTLVIQNAAGGGSSNRMSPRAVVAVIQALEMELARHHLSLIDVLPVAGVDPGTLEERFTENDYRGTIVAKTGTIASLQVSALAGVAHTHRFGRVHFAILNKGIPVLEARERQDAFMRALLDSGRPARQSYRKREDLAFNEAQIRFHSRRETPGVKN